MDSGLSTSLREQLCQVEQSLGVCHVAHVQPWPYSVRRSSPSPAPKKLPGRISPASIHPPVQIVGSAPTLVGDRGLVVHRPRTPRSKGTFTRNSEPRSARRARPDVGSPESPFVMTLTHDQWQRITGNCVPNDTSDAQPCGRLLEQLAGLRQHAREFTSRCDGLQTFAVLANQMADDCDDAELSSLEAAHVSSMQRAERLLGIARDKVPLG